MKTITLSLTFILLTSLLASAQLLPTFQFGVKGGVNLSSFTTDNTFSSDNKAGYLAGIWARVGGAGFHLQPELYYTSKMATVNNNGQTNTVTLNSFDVPVLVGIKVGTLGIGGRVATGPVASFIINKNQSASSALGNITSRNYKDQNYAWQFGAGVDVQKISVDLRYELGLSNLNSDGYNQKLNLFNLSLAYRLF